MVYARSVEKPHSIEQGIDEKCQNEALPSSRMPLTLLLQRMRYFHLQGHLFCVAISLDLIPFAACEVGHEDRFAAIFDGSS